MVVIKIFMNEVDAEISRGKLESEGIRTIISSDDAGGMVPALQPSEGVRLIVAPEDEKKAKEILGID
jgi:hypothetical protein